MDNPICQLWGTMGPSMSTMLPPDVMGETYVCCCFKSLILVMNNGSWRGVGWGVF